MSVDSTNCLDLPEAYEADKGMVSLGMKADIFPNCDRGHSGAVSLCDMSGPCPHARGT